MSLPFYLAAGVAACALVFSPEAEAQTHFTAERAGDSHAQDVMFIPGLASPGEVWTETVDALGSEIDAHVITAAGFGDLAPSGEGAFIAPLVEDLAAYVDSHQIEGLTLVGHSMGAQIALQLAAVRPQAVDQVIVVDSAPFYARLFNPAITPEQAAGFGQGMAAQMASMSRDQYLSMSRQGLMIQSITEDGQARVMSYMERADQSAVARAMGEVAGTDFTSVLGEVDAEIDVLVAWAPGAPVTQDQLRGIYGGQYASARDAEVHMITDSRHFIMFDQAERFVEFLRSELDD